MTSEWPVVTLVSVNVALPEIIGIHRGHPVSSAIRKRAITAGGTITLTSEQLAGDQQADPRVHGGADKAVYAYPAEHLAPWTAELQPTLPYAPGTFGENLTVGGWLEGDARIGDVWAWGDALLQISQPRYPCYKLGIATGRIRVLKQMLATGRTGWYLRVLRAGDVPLAGPIAVVDRGCADASVTDAVLAMRPGAAPELVARIANVEALAAAWRNGLN